MCSEFESKAYGYNKVRENSPGKIKYYHSPQNKDNSVILRAEEFKKPD